MKAVRHQEQTAAHKQRLEGRTADSTTGPTLDAREKHYLVWGLLRLTLGILQMTFAAAAILNLIFSGLSAATLSYAAVATVATVCSRVLYRGRRGVRS